MQLSGPRAGDIDGTISRFGSTVSWFIFAYSTMALKQATVHVSMLLLTIPFVSAQSLELVYFDRSGTQPGNNQIFLECRRNSIAVTNPQIWVEWSNLPRQSVAIVDNQRGRVGIRITQELEGSYSCSDNGDRSNNTLELVGERSFKPSN